MGKQADTGDDNKVHAALTSSTSLSEGSTLGIPRDQKRFFWQRSKAHDPNSVATLPSVFDDPDTAEKYQPRPDW